jgi:glucose-6-phosphate 1-epimerase
VGDISAVKVSGLGDTYIDKVDNAKEGKLSDGVQAFPDRTDRVYLHPEACSVIHDGALNRGIEVVIIITATWWAGTRALRCPSAWPT